MYPEADCREEAMVGMAVETMVWSRAAMKRVKLRAITMVIVLKELRWIGWSEGIGSSVMAVCCSADEVAGDILIRY